MKYALYAALLRVPAAALDRPGTAFKVFQFPPNMIPRIDGNREDWKIVPESYAIGMDQLVDDWDFAQPGLHNDTFELVVDGDLWGGPLIERCRPTKERSERDAHFSMHGAHAQNYHLMTPAVGKDWTPAWGCNAYVKNLPYANAAYSYNFKPGEPGKLLLEFWITPFDYAGCEGPQRAVESVWFEDKLIGMAWAVMDYDNPASESHSFWNLMDRRMVFFKDETAGQATRWEWQSGDGSSSTEQHPIDRYKDGGDYTVVLNVKGPEGASRREKIWDVAVR